MLKVWNFGSTTVRNPNRIQDGLRVYRDIGGSVYGSVDERVAEGHDISEDEHLLIKQALDENAVIVSQTTAFYD